MTNRYEDTDKVPEYDVPRYDNTGVYQVVEALDNDNFAAVERFLTDPKISKPRKLGVEFQYACATGKTSTVKRLLPHVNPSINDNYGFVRACKNAHVDIIDLLMNDTGFIGSVHKLLIACRYGHLNIVKRLIQEFNMDPDGKGITPIAIACQHGRVDVVEYLLRFTDPSVHNNIALRCAIMFNHVVVIECLLRDQRVDPRFVGIEYIELAILRESIYVCEPMVKRLLQDPRTSVADNNFRVIAHTFENGALGHCNPYVNIFLQDSCTLLSIQHAANTFASHPALANRVIKLQKQWYNDRSAAFRELHTELVAAVLAK